MMTCTSDKSGKASSGVCCTDHTPHAAIISVASSTKNRLTTDQRIRAAITSRWSLTAWALYAGLLYGRRAFGWHGRKAAFFAIAGFIAYLLAYLGLKLASWAVAISRTV